MFDTGRFRTTPVPLGEITMGPDGRLLVLGGYLRIRERVKAPGFAYDGSW
jgi:hypothetical protein